MKKLSKLFACIGLALCLTFGLTACTPGEVEENTRTAVETTTSIIPVEYTKETAEGVLNNALYNLFSAEKVDVSLKQIEMDGVRYSEGVMNQKVLIKNGKRYIAFDTSDYYTNASWGGLVVGIYGADNKKFIVDVDSKRYAEIPNLEEGEEPENPEEETVVELGAMLANMIESLDIISHIAVLSEYVVSGRYFDGATYINIKYTEATVCSNLEIKIVDGKIVSISAFVTEDYEVVSWGTYSFAYGKSVDTSMIPTTLYGYTESTLGTILQTTPVTPA